MSMLSNMTQRDRMLVSGLGIFLIIFLSYYLVIKPKADELSDAREQYETEVAAYETDKNHLKRLKELERRFELTEIELIKVKKAIPSKIEMASLVVEIANIFSDSGIAVEQFKPQEMKVEGLLTVQNVDVLIKHKSSMYRLLSALRRIESSSRYMKIVAIDSKVEQASDTEELTEKDLKTNVSISVYSLNGEPGSQVVAGKK